LTPIPRQAQVLPASSPASRLLHIRGAPAAP